MDTTSALLIKTLRAFLRHDTLPPFDRVLLPAARKHNVHNLIASAYPAECRRVLEGLAAQNDVQEYAFSKLTEAFNSTGICVLPMKGISTKKRYADPLYRTMGDIDLLIKPEQNAEVRAVMKELGYELGLEGRKHDHYELPPFLTVEIHRTIEDSDKHFVRYYRKIWDLCRPESENGFVYRLSIEDEYIMNLVHLATHFKKGGVGIRFLLDVFVYERSETDRAYIAKQLELLGIAQFYENIRAIAAHWFGDGPALNETQLRLADYIADGGTFGHSENNRAISVSGGRIRYLFASLFPSFRSMSTMFPWLKKRPYLLPYAWAVRAFRALRDHRERLGRKFKIAVSGDKQKGKALKAFFRDCGLS